MIRRTGVDDSPEVAAVVRVFRRWGVFCGLAVALITLVRLAPPLVGVITTLATMIVAGVVYLRTVHPVARGRTWGLLSLLPAAQRLRYIGCAGPAALVWLWLFVGDYTGAVGRPGGLLVAAVVIATGMIGGAWWASSGLVRR